MLEQYCTWTSCCDLLKSLDSSQQADFFIGNYDWPSVVESNGKHDMTNQSMECSAELDVQGLEDLHITSHPETEDESKIGYEMEIRSENGNRNGDENEKRTLNMNGSSDSMDWEMVEMNREEQEPSSINEYEIINMVNSDKSIPKNIPSFDKEYSRRIGMKGFLGARSSTYCDVVKIPVAKVIKESTLLVNGKRNMHQLSQWKPRFEMMKVTRNRVDRHYGPPQGLGSYDHYTVGESEHVTRSLSPLHALGGPYDLLVKYTN